jgi:RNA polymerase sigma factor (sigma-70 family)
MDRFTFDDLYVRRLKEHDREIEDHFSEYFRGILLAKLRMKFSPQDVDDVIQDVQMRVLERLDELREGSKLGAFVLGVCKYVVLELYDPKNSRTESLGEKHDEIKGPSDIEAELIKKETAAFVRHVLSDMGNSRKAQILRAVFLEEDRDSICRRFKITPENLRVVLHRARKKFAAAYRRKRKPWKIFEMFILSLSLLL